MAKTGRPRKDLDWNTVESLVILGASEDFIAERLLIRDGEPVNGASIKARVRLLQRRIREQYDCSFVEFREKKAEGTKVKLLSWQLRAAESGNVTMLIWLGKQLLGQRDKQEIEQTVKTDVSDAKQKLLDELARISERIKEDESPPKVH